ncbi:MAG: hypothetical protein GEU93_03260 [Propionibacteriales bacterium]|nr:hypothetical protein [Propionibacteriales bacterium]
MNNTTDPIFEALDRLARVADTNPVGDPMPGIMRKARANRRRATALAAGGVAAVVAVGFGVASALDVSGSAGPSGPVSPPSTTPTPTPSPTEPALEEFERAPADVDGDGAVDIIRVMVPPADAKNARDSIVDSKDVRLQVKLDGGGREEVKLGKAPVPTIAGTPDLDENGTADVVLSFSGGDAGWLRVFTWDGDTVVQAEPAAGSPADLVNDGGLYTAAEIVSSALVDGDLISWVPTADTSAPYEVRTWTWQLDKNRLVATESGIQCWNPDDLSLTTC